MNLLELQVLAVVSRISDGNDDAFPDRSEPAEDRAHATAGSSDGEAAALPSADAAGVKMMV